MEARKDRERHTTWQTFRPLGAPSFLDTYLNVESNYGGPMLSSVSFPNDPPTLVLSIVLLMRCSPTVLSCHVFFSNIVILPMLLNTCHMRPHQSVVVHVHR